MDNEKNILQILDQSACLRKGQLLGYLNHSLYPEELRVVELHLSSCALCSDALDGMETVKNAEQLIASIVLPVLPAVILPEKVAEKKEAPAAIKVAEPVVVMSHPKGRHAKTSIPAAANPNDNTVVRKKKSNWLIPVGIAAALVIGFVALWNFEFNDKTPDTLLASNNNDTIESPKSKLSNDQVITSTPVDSTAVIAARKIQDSTSIARKKSERLKAAKDSLLLAASPKSDTVSNNPENKTAGLVAAKDNAENNADETKPAAAPKKVTASKQAMVSEEAMAKKKEDAKATASDFELGMLKYKENNFASALLYFKTAESDKKNSKHWEAIYYSGMCNKSLNKKRKAIKYFEQVVEAKAPQAKAAQRQLDNLKKEN
jgi:hypothetical protein